MGAKMIQMKGISVEPVQHSASLYFIIQIAQLTTTGIGKAGKQTTTIHATDATDATNANGGQRELDLVF